MPKTGHDERVHQGVEDDWICVGAFGGAHGIKGEVRLKSYTANSADIFAYKDIRIGAGGKAVTLKKVREAKDGFIVRASGVRYRDEAEAIKGKKLFVARDALADSLDEDEFFLADLIGLEARDTLGSKIGFVRAVENFGAEDLVEVLFDEQVKGIGRYGFIPFRKKLVPTVDIASGYVTVDLDLWLADQVIADPEPLEDQG